MCSMFFHTNKPFELSSPSLLYGSYVLLNTDVTRSFSLGGTEQSPKNPNVLQNKKTTHLREISYKEQKKACLFTVSQHKIQEQSNHSSYRHISSLVWYQHGALLHSTPFLKQKPSLARSTPILHSAQCHLFPLCLYQSAAVLC